MNVAPLSMFLCLVAATASDNIFFGNLNTRHPADVAADVEIAGILPTQAYDQVAPSVLAIAKTAKPTALAFVAVDSLVKHAGEGRASELIAYLDECLSGISDDRGLRKHKVIEAFLTLDLAQWGQGIRHTPSTRHFLKRAALTADQSLGLNNENLVVESLLAVVPAQADQTAMLIDLVRQPCMAAPAAVERLSHEPSAQTLAAIRSLAAATSVNRAAIEILSNVGDTGSVQTILSHRAAAVTAGDKVTVAFIDQAVRRINLLNPPSNLVSYIRSPDDDEFTHEWAVRKALEKGTDRADIRTAILSWGSGVRPQSAAGIKYIGLKLGVLHSDDLPNVSIASLNMQAVEAPQRRNVPLEIPDRRAKQLHWKANNANWPRFIEWHGTQDWRGMTNEEILRRLKSKLCELDLLSPDVCETLAASQPGG